ncbi:MAG: hypothetical protein KF799_10625 [Bdellovibrionales bacterium]|nr:hypothetical protein [Bdellovibrionales bacterium]
MTLGAQAETMQFRCVAVSTVTGGEARLAVKPGYGYGRTELDALTDAIERCEAKVRGTDHSPCALYKCKQLGSK